MVSRREFVVGGGAAVTLATLDKFHINMEQHGEPLTEAPTNADEVLYVYPELHWLLSLNGDPIYEKRHFNNTLEYLMAVYGYSAPTSLDDFRFFFHEWGLRPKELFEPEPIDALIDFPDGQGPGADAFHRLSELGLDEDPQFGGTLEGGLIFVDGRHDNFPSNFLEVCAQDGPSVSLLQRRLNQLGAGIEIMIVSGAGGNTHTAYVSELRRQGFRVSPAIAY